MASISCSAGSFLLGCVCPLGDGPFVRYYVGRAVQYVDDDSLLVAGLSVGLMGGGRGYGVQLALPAPQPQEEDSLSRFSGGLGYQDCYQAGLVSNPGNPKLL